jgi:hypothetical protein
MRLPRHLKNPQIVEEQDQPIGKVNPEQIFYRIRNISMYSQLLRKMERAC